MYVPYRKQTKRKKNNSFIIPHPNASSFGNV